MPYKERDIEKLYYSIGEVAELLDVNTSLLRYWEKEFNNIKPRKNTRGERFYTKEDIETLKVIYHLVKEKGYTLDGAKTRIKDRLDEEQKKLKVIERLKEVRSFLLELKEHLDNKP